MLEKNKTTVPEKDSFFPFQQNPLSLSERHS